MLYTYPESKIRHCGPDWSGCITANNTILAHERLAIVGVDTGAQPLVSDDNNLVLCVNGEIYNHKQPRANLKNTYEFKTHSDCEVIMPMKRNRVISARNLIGVTTLYYGWDSKMPGTAYFASELKSLNEDCDKILAFPPGHLYDSDTGEMTRWFDPSWWNESHMPTNPVDPKLLRESLETTIASAGVPDDDHQAFDAISDVIYHPKTDDVTTIRASTPMYTLSQRIKATGVKMVLSGEGADEDFLEVAMNIDPMDKKPDQDRMEKYIVRKAFISDAKPYLPDHDIPTTKEASMYRVMFEEWYPQEACTANVVR
ncbi:hypothetical protein BC941DRAFT_476909 [Chlamydoabsidia padenii]|nr:hypothetical protein BC941DRAFT_476909 [Chlamydoabsidia padenii]